MTGESCASGRGHRQEPLLTEAWQGRGGVGAPAPLSSCSPLFPVGRSRWKSGGQVTEPASGNRDGEDGARRKRAWRAPRPQRLLSGVCGGVSGHRGLTVRRESEAEPAENCRHGAAGAAGRMHSPRTRPSRSSLWAVRMVLGLSSLFKSLIEAEWHGDRHTFLSSAFLQRREGTAGLPTWWPTALPTF